MKAETVTLGITLGETLEELRLQGLLDEQGISQIQQYLAGRKRNQGEPWFVKLLLAMGAWIAAICFVSCLGIAGLIDDDPVVLFAWGFGLLVVATGLRWLSDHVFPAQLALAASSMGHGFVLVGAAMLTDGDGVFAATAIAAVLLCVVLYPLYPDSLHRFLSCLVAAGFLTAWIVNGEVWQLIHVEILTKVVLLGVVFVYRSDLRILRPLGYAIAISLPASLFLVLLPDGIGKAPWWPANIVLAAALIWLFQWVAGGWNRMRSEPMLIAVGATICLATFTTPGVLAAVGLMVLGYAQDDRYLMGIGILFFPIFIVVFYYEWQVSLLIKSWIMAGSGAILLFARWFLSFRGWARESL